MPSTYDAEWERRYSNFNGLLTSLEEDLEECEDAVDEREQLGDQLFRVWFPEEAAEQSKVHPIAQAQEATEGTADNPYILEVVPDDPNYSKELDVTARW